jgi:ketosteroid isomerase-like protein
MDSANVQLVRSIYAGWERGNFGSVEWADPEIEYVYADGPSPGRWTGLAGASQGVREFLGAWQNFRLEAKEYRGVDAECVLVLNRRSGRGKTSGLALEQLATKGVQMFQIRDGAVVRLVVYFDRERGLTELGLAQAPPG